MPEIITFIGIWIAALFTLMAYSFLFGDNPVYRFAENAFIGASIGFSFVTIWHQTLKPNLFIPLFSGNLISIIPLILSIMMLMHLSEKLNWLGRPPLAMSVGVYSGFAIIAAIQGDLFPQIGKTIIAVKNINDFVIILGVVCTLYFFHFSREQKGALKIFSFIGRFILMVYFGASFGFTVMSRLSILIGRIQFLIYDWLRLVER